MGKAAAAWSGAVTAWRWLVTWQHGRTAACAALGGIAAATTVDSFAQSYRGLLGWAWLQQVPAPFSWWWPLMIDAFLAMGELRLFIAAVDGPAARNWRVLFWAWSLTLLGLAASVAGNVGHVGWAAPLARKLTAAVAPVAAAAALGTVLGLVKLAAPARTKAVNQTATTDRAPEPHTRRPVSRPAPAPSKPAQARQPARTRQRGADDPKALTEAERLLAEQAASGKPLTPRTLARQSGLSRYRATQLLAANGHTRQEQ